MNPAPQANPLDQLRDIHLPEAVSWWPLAPGWWLLMVLTCLLLVGLLIWLYRRHQSNRYRRQAIQQLQTISSLQAAFRLLKQTANVAYPQQHFGSLPLEEFLNFLQKSCAKTVFVEPTFSNLEAQLVEVLYAEQKIAGNAFTDHFLADTKTWIRYHRKVAEEISPC